jgi:hypothetical protein
VSTQAESHFSQLDQELRTKITTRIEDEFKTPNMQRIIREVSQEQVRSGQNAELLNMSRSIDDLRADFAHYAMPRTFTPKQKTDVINYLSHNQPRTNVVIRADSSDGEAMNYVSQILEIMSASNWDAQFDPAHPPTVPGLTIAADIEGQGRPSDAKHRTPEWVLNQAFQQIQIEYGGRTSMNKQSYALYIEVGKRPWKVINPVPGRK